MFPVKDGDVIAMAPSAGVGRITALSASMAQLAKGLERVLRVFVHDETGLPGSYFIVLEYGLENHPPEIDLPALPTALQEQLGLKLERRRGPVEGLVIDHVEKTPTAN